MSVSSTPIVSAETSAPASFRRTNPLAMVIRWELHRLGAARSTWIIVFLTFVFSCSIELAVGSNRDQHAIPSTFGPRTFEIDWFSNYGLFHTLPSILGLVLALFLPFLCTDGIARDLKRRTHELLMTTAVPSWAYVWGRYLSGLLMGLGLACLMLLALVFVAVGTHQIQPDLYLVPDLHGIFVLWALIVLPPALILSSMSFTLGTLWPGFSTLIKVVLLLGWFLIGPIISRLNLGSGGAVWDPTSQAVANVQTTGTLLKQLTLKTQHQRTQLFLANLHALEQRLPDVSPWITPRLAWIGLGIVCVLLATLFFRRFRNVVG